MKTYNYDELFKISNKDGNVLLSSDNSTIEGNQFDSSINFYFYGTTLSIDYQVHSYLRSTSVNFIIDKGTTDEVIANVSFNQPNEAIKTYTFSNLSNKLHKFELQNVDTTYFYWGIKSVSVDDSERIFKNLYLLKENNKYYSINNDNYDSTNLKFNEVNYSTIITNGFGLYKLSEEITINDETFKPINKFNNFKLACANESNFILNSRKSNKQLVIASASFVTKIANNIDYFKVISNIENNSYIKMAVSIDAGVTWKTTNDNGTTWNDLTNKMPLKDYEIMTSEEKTQWNNLLNEINTDGFDISNIENINFNTLNSEIIMFAYVLYQDNYNDACNNISLEWQFDSKGKMLKMNDTEYEVVLTGNRIVYTPKIDNDLIKVNIINGVLSGTGTSSDINVATSDDIQDILNKRWN